VFSELVASKAAICGETDLNNVFFATRTAYIHQFISNAFYGKLFFFYVGDGNWRQAEA